MNLLTNFSFFSEMPGLQSLKTSDGFTLWNRFSFDSSASKSRFRPALLDVVKFHFRPRPSLNSELSTLVSSFIVAVGREILSNSSISFDVKLSFKKPKLA